MSGGGECVHVKLLGSIDVKVDTQGCDLDEDVADLRFEVGGESSAAETELVLVVCLSMLNSLKFRKSGLVRILFLQAHRVSCAFCFCRLIGKQHFVLAGSSGFPMSLQKQNAYKLTVKTTRGASNSRHETSIIRGTVIIISTVFAYFVSSFV